MTSFWRLEALRCLMLAIGLLVPTFLSAQFNAMEPGEKPDTTKENRPKVDPLTRKYRSAALRYGGRMTDSVSTQIQSFHRWDPTDTLSGWVQHLGQVGKPYRHYKYGLPDEYLGAGAGYLNPWVGRHDVYLWDLQQTAPYFDSRTPFARADFAQSRHDVQLLGATFAVNPTPRWNVGVQYQRRSAIGAYLGFITDQYQIAVGQQFNSKNGRYQGFVSGGFQQLRDQLNGGTLRSVDPTSEVAFGKAQRPPVLSPSNPANLERRMWSASTLHRYRIAGSDSSRLALAIVAWASGENYREQYRDPNDYSLSSLSSNTNPRLYPLNWYDVRYLNADDSLFFQPRRRVRSMRGGGGVQGEMKFGIWKAIGHVGLQPETQYFADSSFSFLRVNGLRQEAWLEVSNSDSALSLRFDSEVFANNIWDPQRRLKLHGDWRPFSIPYRLVDSTAIDTNSRFFYHDKPEILAGNWQPIRFHLHFEQATRNPPFGAAVGMGPVLPKSLDWQNERLNHIRGGVVFVGRSKLYRGFAYRPFRASIEGFVSELRRPFAFDAERQFIQAESLTPLRWIGATISGRARLGRFYLENETTFQQSTNQPTGFARYGNHLPGIYGKASTYYENKIRRTGLTLHAGLACRYFTSHSALDFDPITGGFYPQNNNEIPGYAAIDVIVAGRFKQNTYIFIKMIHVNEGIGSFGYYTTPYYPMLERSFSFGVNWMFFN